MRKAIPIGATLVVGALAIGASTANADSGFSYMEPVGAGVSLKVLATSGDKVGGYTFFGLPDGMGVLADGANATLLVNHEISSTDAVGAVAKRANGAANASTVSALNFDTGSQTVQTATELLKNISWYNYTTGQYSATPGAPAGAAARDSFNTANHSVGLNRFCSSSTSQPGMLSYTEKLADGKTITYGYTGPAYWTGEEGSDESRGFVADNRGNLVQLPRLGLTARETEVVVPTGNKVTAVVTNEDGAANASQVWMYVGEKTTTGSWVDKAGLTNGNLFVMKVTGYNDDNLIRTGAGKGKALPVTWAPVNWNQNGVAQNIQAQSAGTVMARVEDGAFDPKNPSDYYCWGYT